MSKRQGPPKHQNKYAWKPNAGKKINETEVGGRFRPLSEITGVCPRCREQIDWKRRYGKYKPLTEPAKCQGCSKRAVRQVYHNLCTGCAKEQNVCAKCRCRVDQIVGRDLSEVEAEKKMLEEALRTYRERDRRTLLRTMNKGTSNTSSEKPLTSNVDRVGDLFPASTLEEYAAKTRGEKVDKHSKEGNDEDEEDEDTENDQDEDDNEDEHESNSGDEN